ncbi:MAG: metallophosphoesterase [Lachnospiraceae bacterium]|nr:metallophosphoesterase [Lachnospiraceae bacterium]
MRFIHIADLHLGMEPDKDCSWSKMRGRELWDAFSNIIEICRKEKTDLLLIAGDLFHKQPLVRELKEAAGLLSAVPDTKTVIIAGNHDYISGTSGYRNFKWPENVTFLMSDHPESVYFEDINTEVFGFSYHTRDISEPLLDDISPTDRSRINILIGHGGEPSKVPADWKKIERAGFDYVAMGHLHKPIDISETIRYSGSLEPVDLNETGRHGYIAGEICTGAATADPSHSSPEAGKAGSMGKTVSTTRVAFAKREYIKADIGIGVEDTYGSLRSKVKALIDEKSDRNLYILRLFGEYDPQITFDLEGLSDMGYIVRIIDETRPKLDLQKLHAANDGNVIGMFIDRMKSSPENDRISEKALFYGIMALTGDCPQNYY